MNSLTTEFNVINKVFSMEKLEQFEKLGSEMEKVVFDQTILDSKISNCPSNSDFDEL